MNNLLIFRNFRNSISQFLEPNDLQALAPTCKGGRDACNESPTWERLAREQFPNVFPLLYPTFHKRELFQGLWKQTFENCREGFYSTTLLCSETPAKFAASYTHFCFMNVTWLPSENVKTGSEINIGCLKTGKIIQIFKGKFYSSTFSGNLYLNKQWLAVQQQVAPNNALFEEVCVPKGKTLDDILGKVPGQVTLYHITSGKEFSIKFDSVVSSVFLDEQDLITGHEDGVLSWTSLTTQKTYKTHSCDGLCITDIKVSKTRISICCFNDRNFSVFVLNKKNLETIKSFTFSLMASINEIFHNVLNPDAPYICSGRAPSRFLREASATKGGECSYGKVAGTRQLKRKDKTIEITDLRTNASRSLPIHINNFLHWDGIRLIANIDDTVIMYDFSPQKEGSTERMFD